MSSITDEQLDANLALFFTFGVSMAVWHEEGLLDRELALYEKLASASNHIYIFTYGDERDLQYMTHLPDNVTIVPKRYVSNDLLYSFLCPIIHWRTFRSVDIAKTNQMLGSWTAILGKLLFQYHLVVRTGYVLSIFYEKLEKPYPMRVIAAILEQLSYLIADGVITSSTEGYDYLEERYVVRGEHRMIPNYIETDVFRPLSREPAEGSICYIGRLAPQKNVSSLIRAIGGTPYTLTIVGSGDLRDELEQLAQDCDASARFKGTLPNHELPEVLNTHELFVLPSYFEGMPKTLLEAMSCGRPCVGTRVAGIQEVIDHESTGLLCDTSSEAIHEAIDRLMEDEELRRRLGENARTEILQEYSLDSVVVQELQLYSIL